MEANTPNAVDGLDVTEQDYTNIEDKIRVSNALNILREIVPEKTQVIKADELKQIVQTLFRWHTALFKELEGKIKTD